MRQRGEGSWELRVYVGRDPLNGQKRWSYKTFKGGKREAERALAGMVAATGTNVVAPTSGTMAELLDRWLDYASADFSPKTALETTGFINRYLKPGLGPFPVAKLRTEDVDKLYRELRNRGGHNGRPLAAGTVKRTHVILHRALEQAVRWGWVATNPAHNAQVPRTPPAEVRPPTPKQLVHLFELAGDYDPGFATFILLAAMTGARRSELLALRWSDVDYDAGQVTFARGVVFGAKGLVEKDTKTHAVRRVALDPRTAEVLAAHRERVDERAAQFGTVIASDTYVFSHKPDGSEPWRPDSATRAFRHLLAKAGLHGVRLHDLRHYVATQLLAAGVDVRTVAGRLGHRNASTTLNVYSHFLEGADKQAAQVLAKLLDDSAHEDTQSDDSTA